MLLIAACQPKSHSTESTREDAASKPTASAPLPTSLTPSCVVFLSDLDCWLRRAGNDPQRVDVALGAVRAVIESHPWGGPTDESPQRCERAIEFHRVAFAETGCENPHRDVAGLPPSDPVNCPSHEHFFVRVDGKVSGCHPDCTTSGDCPRGSTCSSVGWAPGGPIGEAFCE